MNIAVIYALLDRQSRCGKAIMINSKASRRLLKEFGPGCWDAMNDCRRSLLAADASPAFPV